MTPTLADLVAAFRSKVATNLADFALEDGLRAVLETLRPVVTKACGQAMACAHPESYQGEKSDDQLQQAFQREHDLASLTANLAIDRLVVR